MIVAGFGLRASATESALRATLAMVTPPAPTALAAPADKAGHPALQALATALGLPLVAVALDQITAQAAATTSPNQPARYGTRSVAESAALAACGPGARLIRTRQIGPGGLATIALAESVTP